MNETKDILFGHFFEILIDSSNCVHCFLNEVLFKGQLSSSSVKRMKIYTKNEIFQVGYRTYDEAEILAFTDQCLKKKWIVKEINGVQKINQRFEISNYGKTKENQDSFISNYKCEKGYLKEIYEELEDIKKRVTLLGFRF